MNTICFQRILFLVSFAAIAGAGSGLSAVAQTRDVGIDASAVSSVGQPIAHTAATDTVSVLPEVDSIEATDLAEQLATLSDGVANKQPVPGSAETTASALFNRPASSQTPRNRETPANSPSRKGRQVAQLELQPGRSTRSGSSYIGVGGNLGLTGDTGVGDTGFVFFGKLGLTRVFSVRPQIVIGDDTDFVIPITYDFAIQAEPFQRLSFAPYVGAGLIISTDGDSNLGLALTGGVDVPISTQFTATAALTAGFIDTTDLGILIGIGYNFGPGFRF